MSSTNKKVIRTSVDPCGNCLVVGRIFFYEDGTHEFKCRCTHPFDAFSTYGITAIQPSADYMEQSK